VSNTNLIQFLEIKLPEREKMRKLEKRVSSLLIRFIALQYNKIGAIFALVLKSKWKILSQL
jgi:hypothetical protein